MVRLYLKRPVDTYNMGLSQLLLLGRIAHVEDASPFPARSRRRN